MSIDRPHLFRLILLIFICVVALIAAIAVPLSIRAAEQMKFDRWSEHVSVISNDPALLGYYIFESEAPLEVNNMAKITLPGSVSESAKTRHGRWPGKGALYLPGGNNSYMLIRDKGLFDPGRNNFTVLLWFKASSHDGTGFLLAKNDNLPTTPSWSLSRYGADVQVAMVDNKLRGVSVARTCSNMTEWSFAGFVVDRRKRKLTLFINGEPVGETALRPDANFVSANPITLVGRSPSTIQPFKGYIDEVAIFSRALSDQQVKSFYNVGRP